MTDAAKTSQATADGAGGADEFAHIPRPRARHPLFAVAGALLAFYLVFHLRDDLRYALSSGEVTDLGAVRTSLGGANSAQASDRLSGFANRYVRIAGTPDRESALELDTKGSWVFSQFFRMMGTDDRLFLHRRESPLAAARAEQDVFVGRLIRFDSLSFADAIRAHFAKHVTATHFFAPDLFVRALAARSGGAALTLVDRAGDQVSLPESEEVVLELVKPDQVQIGLPQTRFPTEADARAAVETRGGEVLASRGLVKTRPVATTSTSSLLSSAPAAPERWTLVVRFAPARREAALAEIADLDRLVEIREAREALRAKIGALAPAGQGVAVRLSEGERRLGTGEISAVHTPAAVVIPADAYLLVEGDHPREHLPTVFIALVLVTFGAINIVGLIRDRIRR
jgi:hypothetical protein